MPHMEMEHEVSPAAKLVEQAGDISNVEVFNNQLLVAVYVRPAKTKSGIYLTDKTTEEDRYQSKIGLVLKMGDSAFNDKSGEWFNGVQIEEGDWIIFGRYAGARMAIDGGEIRILNDDEILATIKDPEDILHI